MKYDEENQTLDIDLKGNDMGVLIGREDRHWILCSIWQAWLPTRRARAISV